MKIDFLGCSGGIEGSTPVGKSLNDYARSTCYRINDHVLIDAGTGAGRMGMSEMVRIEHILLTHAHLDHVACLPLMIDTIAGLRKTPTRTWGLPGVLDDLSCSHPQRRGLAGLHHHPLGRAPVSHPARVSGLGGA